MWVSAGIDFGNKNIVLAIPRNGGVDVIANSTGNRLTPSVVCYTGDRRYFGDAAVQQETMYLDTTIQQFKRLISVPYNSKEREEIQNIVSFKLVENTDGTTGVEIEFHGEKMIIRPEQCIAYLLKNVDKMARHAQSSISEYVIAVSPWWPEKQRIAILNACKIAKLNCMALVNSTTAAAIAYTKIHAQRLPEDNPVPVAFIDFGNSSMNVAIALLKQGSVSIKSFTYDDKLGGSHFTVELIKFLLQKVQEIYKMDPTTNRRAMIQFRNAAEKLKKTLSINTQVQFEIPNLMNDKDVKFVVKRDEFNEHIKGLIEKVTAPIEAALEKANIDKEDLFDIEFLGGGSRVPAVKDKIAEYFGKEAKCSLNLDECFAYGSAYMAAYLNPSTRVNLTVKDVSPYSVEAEWNEGEQQQTKELFEQFSEVPSSTTLELKVKNSSEVTIKSNNDVICVVNIETGVEEEVTVNLNVKLTQSSIVEIETASFKYEDKEKAAKVTTTRKEGLSDEEIENLRKIEDMFEASDLAEEKLDNTKNNLQSMYFTLLNDIRDNSEYINDDLSKQAQEKVNEVMAWYDENEFEKLPIEEYEKQIKAIREYKDPIEKRINSLKNAKQDLFPSLLKRIQTIINETNSQDENLKKVNEDGNGLKDEINKITENMKELPNDFDVNDLSKKVAFLEGEYKAQKQQIDWRAQQKKNDEELIRRRKQANEEEEMRKRIKEQQMRRQELENEEEEEQIDPFSFLFGQPMQRRQKLRRKQYDPDEEERRKRIEIERQREAQREAERRAELQRRAEEQRRQQIAEEQRRQRRAPWGFMDEDDDQSNDGYYQDDDYDEGYQWNPYAPQRVRRNPQRQQQQLRAQQQREQQIRQQQQREQQLREQQYREQQLRKQQYREQQLREQKLREQQERAEREREIEQLREQQMREQQMREEQARRQQLREQQLRQQQQQRQRQQTIDDLWGDPLAWGDPTPRPQPRRRVQQQPQRRVYNNDIWGNPWGNSGWRDPFF